MLGKKKCYFFDALQYTYLYVGTKLWIKNYLFMSDEWLEIDKVMYWIDWELVERNGWEVPFILINLQLLNETFFTSEAGPFVLLIYSKSTNPYPLRLDTLLLNLSSISLYSFP